MNTGPTPPPALAEPTEFVDEPTPIAVIWPLENPALFTPMLTGTDDRTEVTVDVDGDIDDNSMVDDVAIFEMLLVVGCCCCCCCR